MKLNKKKIIVLANLGGPRSLAEVKQFLLDLLGDPNVIQLPWFFKWFQPILAQIIVKKRLSFSTQLYKEIGGKSPLVEITQRQADLLEAETGLSTFVFMNCGKPNEEELLKALPKEELDVVIIPLFPQYSTTTTKTSFEKLEAFFNKNFPKATIAKVKSYPTHNLFVKAWTERIENKLQRIKGEVTLLFSAHGVPESYIKKGDPYAKEVQESVDAIAKNFPNNKAVLCFQSRLGNAKWLEPYTDNYLKQLPKGSQVLVIPISFVSDHVETIHEIGLEFKEVAEEAGVIMHRVPGLNASETFIKCLADLALNN